MFTFRPPTIEPDWAAGIVFLFAQLLHRLLQCLHGAVFGLLVGGIEPGFHGDVDVTRSLGGKSLVGLLTTGMSIGNSLDGSLLRHEIRDDGRVVGYFRPSAEDLSQILRTKCPEDFGELPAPSRPRKQEVIDAARQGFCETSPCKLRHGGGVRAGVEVPSHDDGLVPV